MTRTAEAITRLAGARNPVFQACRGGRCDHAHRSNVLAAVSCEALECGKRNSAKNAAPACATALGSLGATPNAHDRRATRRVQKACDERRSAHGPTDTLLRAQGHGAAPPVWKASFGGRRSLVADACRQPLWPTSQPCSPWQETATWPTSVSHNAAAHLRRRPTSEDDAGRRARCRSRGGRSISNSRPSTRTRRLAWALGGRCRQLLTPPAPPDGHPTTPRLLLRRSLTPRGLRRV